MLNALLNSVQSKERMKEDKRKGGLLSWAVPWSGLCEFECLPVVGLRFGGCDALPLPTRSQHH